jgi:hypothetical protein
MNDPAPATAFIFLIEERDHDLNLSLLPVECPAILAALSREPIPNPIVKPLKAIDRVPIKPRHPNRTSAPDGNLRLAKILSAKSSSEHGELIGWQRT